MMDRERAGHIYSTMARIRAFEFKALKLFEENKLRGSVHLYIGEEAVASTVCARLTNDDYIASTHRGHGHCIAKGARLDMAMAELMGKATGYCKGRSGSMHIADFTQGNLGANAIVGGGIPIAVGAALSAKMQKQDRVAVSFFGDGASNEGTFHESMNMASVWKLPIIFICENNGYGISVPTWQSTSVKDISVRGMAYDMPGETVDGNDVEAIDAAFERALKRARAGEGPSIIECKTYRWQGHHVGDPAVYRERRDKNEKATWMERCPIENFKKEAIASKLISKAAFEKLEAEVEAEVQAAVQFAKDSPYPDVSEAFTDLFVD